MKPVRRQQPKKEPTLFGDFMKILLYVLAFMAFFILMAMMHGRWQIKQPVYSEQGRRD